MLQKPSLTCSQLDSSKNSHSTVKIENVWGYTALNKTATSTSWHSWPSRCGQRQAGLLASSVLIQWETKAWQLKSYKFQFQFVTQSVFTVIPFRCYLQCLATWMTSSKAKVSIKEHFLPRWNPYNVTKAAQVSKHENKRQACCSQFGVASMCVCVLCVHLRVCVCACVCMRAHIQHPSCPLPPECLQKNQCVTCMGGKKQTRGLCLLALLMS